MDYYSKIHYSERFPETIELEQDINIQGALPGTYVLWVIADNDYKAILEHVREWGLKDSDIELYLQSFRYGVPPLGGFALGAERMTMHILGLKNIREASLFPRDMERVDLRLSQQEDKTSK